MTDQRSTPPAIARNRRNGGFVRARTKFIAVNRISTLTESGPQELGPGSKEQKSVLLNLVDGLGLSIDHALTKQDMAVQIVGQLGGTWGPECQSTGQTITLTGLNRLLECAEAYVGALTLPIGMAPVASDMEVPAGELNPSRMTQRTQRMVRDSILARRLKYLHGGRCQVCGMGIEMPDGSNYSEAHHLRPLGGDHKGPDIPANMIVVCPNHHAMLDYGVIQIDLAKMRLSDAHRVEEEYVEYHNGVVCDRWR